MITGDHPATAAAINNPVDIANLFLLRLLTLASDTCNIFVLWFISLNLSYLKTLKAGSIGTTTTALN